MMNKSSDSHFKRDWLLTGIRYALIAALAIFTLVMFSAGNIDQPFEVVAKKLESIVDSETLQEAESKSLKRIFGLNPADYEGVILYTAKYNMSAEELLLIKVSSESQIEEAKKAVLKRIENRKADFEGYLPEQAALMENAQVIIRGNYIFFVSSEKAAEYKSAFLKDL